MAARAYCDCHVNIWNSEHVLPLYERQLSRVRQGEMAPRADAETIFAEMAEVEKTIVFALRYGDSIGIESDDETTAAAVAQRALAVSPKRFATAAAIKAPPRYPAALIVFMKPADE